MCYCCTIGFAIIIFFVQINFIDVNFSIADKIIVLYSVHRIELDNF